MKNFEYLLLETNSGIFKGVDYKELTSQLNRLGGAGWEVVSTVSLTANGQTTSLLTTLKRELSA
ncbi:DUF4177 domain-containing protein [Hymenobacter sp. RP-2-7]|uniref:DUF4177 domain-containing protein n=1 Tax=Hymenobacter polaris TaxID=2682546 RepID=A0A7Y0AC63_9BACT|nr:DUF4177 domain-containing protein [Hymenobacter polaris]NML64623.1 DUF4177 domain-containing protein [Hymenobacter polaris]